MEYHRRGPHQGFWRLKPTWIIPSDADMLKMVGPEQVVLTESMQVGQRHLQDAGYSQMADSAEGDETNLSVEQQLAPWITTKNFLFATQAKAMLRLHGDGDPTGRGEAFSFIRISMKDIFVKAGEDYEQKMGKSSESPLYGHYLFIYFIFYSAEAENRPKSAHRYNVAEQQQIYKSEIERIWKAQFDSLSRKDEPQLTDEENDSNNRRDPRKQQQQQQQQQQQRRHPSVIRAAGESLNLPYSPAGSPVAATAAEPTGDAPSPAFSRGSSLEREREFSIGPDGNSRRILRIKRLVRINHVVGFEPQPSAECLLPQFSPSGCRSTGSGKRRSSAIPL
jgi:hypothetical protein